MFYLLAWNGLVSLFVKKRPSLGLLAQLALVKSFDNFRVDWVVASLKGGRDGRHGNQTYAELACQGCSISVASTYVGTWPFIAGRFSLLSISIFNHPPFSSFKRPILAPRALSLNGFLSTYFAGHGSQHT